MRVLRQSQVPCRHWLVDIAAAIRTEHEDAVPPGFSSIKEIAADNGFSRSKTQSIMRKAFEAGMIERVLLRRISGKYFRIVPYYAPKKRLGKT